jgi:hypothetical protein
VYLHEAIAYAFAMGHSSIAMFNSSNIAAYDYDGNVESVFQPEGFGKCGITRSNNDSRIVAFKWWDYKCGKMVPR